MTFNSAIWRSTGTTYTEAASSSANKIQFNEEPVITNNAIIQSEFDIRVAIAENERPFSSLNELQDCGVDGVDIIITGRFSAPNTNTSITNLMTWLKGDKTTSQCPYGRFGLRLDDFPWFNVTPSASGGYLLTNVKLIRDGEVKNRSAFILTLRLNGSITVLP